MRRPSALLPAFVQLRSDTHACRSILLSHGCVDVPVVLVSLAVLSDLGSPCSSAAEGRQALSKSEREIKSVGINTVLSLVITKYNNTPQETWLKIGEDV